MNKDTEVNNSTASQFSRRNKYRLWVGREESQVTLTYYVKIYISSCYSEF